MTNSALQLNRIVSLVAHLTRADRNGRSEIGLNELARLLDTTTGQISADLRALTLLGETPDAEWLLSLRVWQEGDRVAVSSGGPFRRPIRFFPDELLAIQLGLAGQEHAEHPLQTELAALLGHPSDRAGWSLASGDGGEHPLPAQAVRDHLRLRIVYAGLSAGEGTERVIQPHQMVSAEGKTYVIGWCERAQAWRRFRMDRILEVEPAGGRFTPRADFEPVTGPDGLFLEPEDGVDAVRVRFSPRISRWIRERHPEGSLEPDGSWVVTYRVASADWLIRQVLQYGEDAVVEEPEYYRQRLLESVDARGEA